jgi:hypothetical protein
MIKKALGRKLPGVFLFFPVRKQSLAGNSRSGPSVPAHHGFQDRVYPHE